MSNADLELVQRFVRAGGATPLAVDSNPLAVTLGLRLISWNPADATLDLLCEPSALFVQGNGVLQGGAISAVLDFAMAFATLAGLPAGQTCATLSMHTSFLAGARPGPHVVQGRIERRGRSTVFASASLRPAGAGAAVLAQGAATLAVREQRG